MMKHQSGHIATQKKEKRMTSRYVLALSITLALAGPVIAQPAGEAKAKGKAPKASASQPVFTAAADLKWIDLDPKGAPGVKIADLWGDHTKGAYGAYLKLPAGFAVPLHTHSHAMKVIFVSGTYIQAPDGKPEVRLGPGSYMMQPGGNYRHTTACDKASDCVFFVESGGAFDLKVVETAKPAAKPSASR
jgi:anti-sigma factor ChrR (cupin superfamily)